jgi:predicted transposase YbfD/YdcC
MQYNASTGSVTAQHAAATTPAALLALDPSLVVTRPASDLTIPLRTLPALFAALPDPRAAAGRRYRLAALLAAVLAALLCNHLSQLAAAEWLRDQPPAVQCVLGFRPGHTPHQSTFNRVLRRVDPAALAAALHTWFDRPAATPRPRASQAVACDGKAQRGRLHATPPAPGVSVIHEVSAFCTDLGTVLAAVAVSATAEKAAAELNSAPALIGTVNWVGRVLTGDALWCQRPLSEQVVTAGGDYLFTVKANQGHLLDCLQRWFAPQVPRRYGFAPLQLDRREATTVDRRRGRYEMRHLIASDEVAGVVEWPHVGQGFMLIRWWEYQGQVGQEIHWGITSLPAAAANAARLLELARGHWGIENRLHYIKDVTLGEDASLLHAEQGPAVMSLLRDAVVSLVHQAGHTQVAARLRYYARHPAEALTLLGLLLPENA